MVLIVVHELVHGLTWSVYAEHVLIYDHPTQAGSVIFER